MIIDNLFLLIKRLLLFNHVNNDISMKTTSLMSQISMIIKFSNKIFIRNFDFQLLNNLPRIIKNILDY